MRRLLILLVAVALAGLPSLAWAESTDKKTEPLTVSLTFDDGFADQMTALDILTKHKMKGTFYIIDGDVGYGAYLTWPQVHQIADAGNEIGGHTVHHPHLSDLNTPDATREVCDDRATLLKLGFNVTSFAYPYGAADPRLGRIAKGCGYNNARDVSGLTNGSMCDGCPMSNTLPVKDRYRIRANSSTTTLDVLQTYVSQAEKGGYVPLIFHHICEGPACDAIPGDEKISPGDFDALLTWLESQPVRIKTVTEVMGGDLQPSVGTPVDSSLQTAAGHIETHASMPNTIFGIGQGRIVGLGIILALLFTFTYRLATRRRRYAP